MRSAFGKFAQELRAKKGLNQTKFAELIGEHVTRVSQMEYQRVSINDDIVNKYIRVLTENGEEAHKLRILSSYSNTRHTLKSKNLPHDRLLALIAEYGENFSSDVVDKIEEILQKNSNLDLSTIEFSSSYSLSKKQKLNRKWRRPELGELGPRRFVEICLTAESLRDQVCVNGGKLDVGHLLEYQSAKSEKLDIDIVDAMPEVARGAFACIIGSTSGHTIYAHQRLYSQMCRGVHFLRHVFGHELAHHILHAESLDKGDGIVFVPQESSHILPFESGVLEQDFVPKVEQIVDSITELEAELFATMLLVPWTEFLKGTSAYYLANDFGEQIGEIKRYMKYFKVPGVLDEFKRALWEQGYSQHPIFRDQ